MPPPLTTLTWLHSHPHSYYPLRYAQCSIEIKGTQQLKICPFHADPLRNSNLKYSDSLALIPSHCFCPSDPLAAQVETLSRPAQSTEGRATSCHQVRLLDAAESTQRAADRPVQTIADVRGSVWQGSVWQAAEPTSVQAATKQCQREQQQCQRKQQQCQRKQRRAV